MMIVAIFAVAVIAYIAGRAHGEHKSLSTLKAADAQLDASRNALTAAMRIRENAEQHFAKARELHERVASMIEAPARVTVTQSTEES